MSQEKELRQKVAELEELLEEKNSEVEYFRSELHQIQSELGEILGTMKDYENLVSWIQKVLAPTEIPQLPGVDVSSKFLPGINQGGDYFDLFEHQDRMRFGILLSASSGYSMSALVLSVLIRLSPTIQSKKALGPAEALQALFAELKPQLKPEDRASLFYAVLDRRTFDLVHASTGERMAFLHKKDSNRLIKIEPGTGPLSQQFSETPLAEKISMNPGDRLLLCSPGVLDASARESAEPFGFERLRKAVESQNGRTVHDVRNEILFQVSQHTGLTQPIRDQTVLVFEVKDRVIKLAK